MIKVLIIGCSELGRRVYEEIVQIGDFELVAMVTHKTEEARSFIKGYPVIHFENEKQEWTRSGAHVAIFCGKLEDDLMSKGGICTQWFNMVDCCKYMEDSDPDSVRVREEIRVSSRRTRHTVISSVIWNKRMDALWKRVVGNLGFSLSMQESDPVILTARILIAYARACVALNNQGVFGLVDPQEVSLGQLSYRSREYEHK